MNHLILRDQGVDRRLRESLPTEEGPRAADALQVFEGVEVHLLRPLSDHNRGGGGVSLDLQTERHSRIEPEKGMRTGQFLRENRIVQKEILEAMKIMLRDSRNLIFVLDNPVTDGLDYQSLVGVADLHVVQEEVYGGGVEGVLAVHPEERRPLQRHLHHLLAHIRGGGGGGRCDQKQRRKGKDDLHVECRSHSLGSASTVTCSCMGEPHCILGDNSNPLKD